MKNTYINDNQNNFYPFYNTGALPFPHSVITGLGICLKAPVSGTIEPLSVSQVYITNDTVKIAVMTGTELLITLEAHTYTSGRSCKALVLTEDREVSGFMTIGSIPESAVGSYAGTWYIDPSCVFFMPLAVYGNMKQLVVNGSRYNIVKTLNIDTSGPLSVDSVLSVVAEEGEPVMEHTTCTINATEDASEYTYEFSNSIGYSMVQSINNQSCITTPASPKTLNIRIQHSTIQYSLLSNDSTVVLIISGTKDFPNCFEADDDGAEATPDISTESARYPAYIDPTIPTESNPT
jgi:hypothetical protein